MTGPEAVRADAETPPEGATVELVTATDSVKLLVPPAVKWGTRATDLLDEGRVEKWARSVLSPDDYEAWAKADPTNEDAAEFLRAWREASGENPGESRASRRSSRSTARR